MVDNTTLLGDRNKRIAKNTIMLYVRTLLIMLVSLYTSRVVLDVLGIDDYGIYEIVGSVVSIFSFVNMAMTASTQRFLNSELETSSPERLKTVFNTSILIHAAISLLILILAETAGLWFLQNKIIIEENRLEAAFWVYQLSVLSSIIMFMGTPYNAAIIAHEKMNVFAYISFLEVIGRLLVVYLLVYIPGDKLILYAVFICVMQFVIRMVYKSYCKRKFMETRFSFIWDKELFYKMLSFCGWNMFGNIAYVSLTQGTSVLLSMFFTPAVNAAKGISFQVQFAINNFCQNFQMAVNPQIIKSYAANEMEYMHRLIFFSSRLSFFLVLLLSLPIIFETNQILHLWLKEVPAYSAIFIKLSLVISLFQSLANPLVMGNAATGKVRQLMATVGVMFWTVIPISYLGLKLGGDPTTVFWVQIVLMAVAHMVRIKIVGKQLNFSFMNYLKETLFRILLVTAICIIPPFIVTTLFDESWFRFFLIIFVSVLTVGIVAFFLGLTSKERDMTKKMILQKIRK